MNCESYLELLSGHLDGENTPAQERALEAHLQECPACRARLAAMRENDELLRRPQANFPAPQLENLGAQKRRRMPPMRRLWTGAATLAAVLALVFFAGRVLSGGTPYDEFNADSPVGGILGEQLGSYSQTGANRDDAGEMTDQDTARPTQSGAFSIAPTEPPFAPMSSSGGVLSGELPEALRGADLPMLVVYGLPQEEIPLGDCDLWSDFDPTAQLRVYKVDDAAAKELKTKLAHVANLEVRTDPSAQSAESWLIVFVLK